MQGGESTLPEPLHDLVQFAQTVRQHAIASGLHIHLALKIEELVTELKDKYTIVMVTHNMQQAARVSDYTGFFLNGDLVEYDKTDVIFTRT